MNTLVFKYGGDAKSNTLSIGDQTLLTGTTSDKLLAGKLFIDGATCNDNNPLSTGETWLNSVCQGGLVPNGTACNDNNIQTISDIYTNNVCAGTNVQGQACDDGISNTYADKYNNGVCVGTNATSCKDIKNLISTTISTFYTIDIDGTGGTAPFQASCDMTTDGGGWTKVGSFNYSGGSFVNSVIANQIKINNSIQLMIISNVSNTSTWASYSSWNWSHFDPNRYRLGLTKTDNTIQNVIYADDRRLAFDAGGMASLASYNSASLIPTSISSYEKGALFNCDWMLTAYTNCSSNISVFTLPANIKGISYISDAEYGYNNWQGDNAITSNFDFYIK